MPYDLRFREFNPLKIWHHADRLRALAAGQDIAPVTVEVDPVAYCNHHCSWCVDPEHKPVTASRAFLWALLEELAQFEVNGFGVQGVVFKGGGEPTLHPDFPELVTKTRSLGFEVGVVTNGSHLLAPGIAEALAREASYVRISVDGPTPETHQRIHGTSDFAEIVTGAERLVAYRQPRHPIIGLSFALDHATIPVLPEAIRLGERLGVDYVLLRPPFFEEVGRAATMSPPQAAELRQQLKQMAQQYTGTMQVLIGLWKGDAESNPGIKASLDASGRRDYHMDADAPIEHRLGQCWASPLLAVVAADGQVYGCCNLRYLDTWRFGLIDYQHQVTFAAIWQSAQRQAGLQRMQATECIAHCTHPMTRYNEIIAVLKDTERPHSGFV